MLRNLCNSPLNLPPIELKYEPILKSPQRLQANLDINIPIPMQKTTHGFRDKYTVSSDAKTRYRFGVFTPTRADPR